MRYVHGRGHGDDDEVGLAQRTRVVRDLEPGRGLELFARHLAGGIDLPAVRVDLLHREIEADGAVLLAELHRQRQADVA
jgi:hypothetical protein